MALETTPKSIASDGNLRVAFVPEGSDAKSVAILGGGTTKALTYSLTPSGLNRTITENSVEDARLTLKTVLSRPGTSTQSLELQYVFGDEGDVAKPALAEGTEGFIVIRYGIPNETDWTIGQEVDILPVLAGKQRKDAPTANGVFTITQAFYVTGVPQDDVTLIA